MSINIMSPLQPVSGAAVSLQSVSKLYGQMVAVDDLSLEVRSGEFVSLLGPSGSGKTTTLMMLAGFQTPTHGQIILGGEDITHRPAYRRNIGVVYQNYALFPHLTVEKNIAFPLRMRGCSRDVIADEVKKALALVRLETLGQRYPHELSGGQQQRVAIARAMVFHPPLLLMDEPLGALDKKLREELQAEIKRLQAVTGSTIIYVTHDQDEALRMSDRVVVMNKGLIEHAGEPEEIYNHPRTRFVADFLGSANFLKGKVEKSDVGGAVFRSGSGLSIPLPQNAPTSTARDVTVVLRPERVKIVPQCGAATENGYRGRIEEISYQGYSRQILVALSTGEKLSATLLSGQTWTPGIGTDVVVSWEKDALHMLDEVV